MLRFIVVAMLAVVALDLAVLAYAFSLTVALALPAVLAVMVVLAWRRRPGLARVPVGWSLGQGVEITHPEAPVSVPVVLPTEALQLGTLIIGAQGAGKTEASLGLLAHLSAAQSGCGWCYAEGKGDIDIYRRLVASGSAPDLFFSAELPGSDSVNLMDGDSFDVVDLLSRLLVGHTRSTDYYSNSQRTALAHVVPVLTGLGMPVNLRDLYAALAFDHAGAELMAIARELGIDANTRKLGETYYAIDPHKRRPLIAGLLDRLFTFVHGPGSDRLNCYQPDIRIADVVREGKRLYLHLPLSEFSKALGMAFMEQFGVEARRRQQRGPEQFAAFPIVCDDWGDLFHANFPAITARSRSARMPFVFGFQSYAQLEAMDKAFADTLDDTSATKIIMRVMGERTSRYATTLLGQHDMTEVGTSELGERAGTVLHVTQRDRVDAQALRSQSPGQAYVSTLITAGDATRNALYKVRLPATSHAGWETVDVPATRTHAEGEGLGLWSRHMDAGPAAGGAAIGQGA